MTAHDRLSRCTLYGILDLGYVNREKVQAVTTELLTGGIGILQLRAKHFSPEQISDMAQEILPLCRAKGCLFIINDYPEIAAAIGADGVHIGQDAGNIAPVRKLLGAHAIIGRSTHSLQQAKAGYEEGSDYIGFGPLFPTGTKPGRAAIGLQDIAPLSEILPSNFPIFCIGGINETTLPQVLHAGAKRVVIVSWLLTHPNISATTATLREQLSDHSCLPLTSDD